MEQREYWDVSFPDKVKQPPSFLSMKKTEPGPVEHCGNAYGSAND